MPVSLRHLPALLPAFVSLVMPLRAEMPAEIRGILENRCFDCHADGAKKGGVAFDGFESEEKLLADKALWHRVLKNVRAGMMPPPEKKSQPSAEERASIQKWITGGVFALNPAQPDPGRPVLRRLNRTEYDNTIRDLTGVNFRVQDEFPADDSGHGFDNIGEVLTVSPMMLEKYLAAAQSIVKDALASHRAKVLPGDVPAEAEARRTYARERLADFTLRAFRRPAETETLDRLVKMAEAAWSQPDKSFDDGIARALEAVLASPRFLFLEEYTLPPGPEEKHPLLDEYSLAARLSYFLWSTLPDAELLKLAGDKKLRENLGAQFDRMLKDERARAFVRNFSGQWLQSRDIEGIPIDARFVLQREAKPDPEADAARRRFFELRRKRQEELTPEESEEMEKLRNVSRRGFDRFRDAEFRREVRRDMLRETELYFAHVLQENRPLTEFLASDYTFLNERLAKHYGIADVTGNDLRKVTLPADSPRGGVLTHGSVLAVTSNPTRTSPVKRGLFILDNILGTPPPPPPPDVPPLEDFGGRGRIAEGTLRQTLEKHRADAACASCHNRMDPLGLAFENFNAMGQWRDFERGQNVDAAGKLITGESFSGARELKEVLVKNHRDAFHRCFAEKILTYALGRGLDWRDEATLDLLMAKLNENEGRILPLLRGVVESAAFQRRSQG
jgi:hypothetical protein